MLTLSGPLTHLSLPPFLQEVSALEEKVKQLEQEAELQKSRHSREATRLRKRIEQEKQNAQKIKETAVRERRGGGGEEVRCDMVVQVSSLSQEWEGERKKSKMTHQREINLLRDKV